MKNYSKLYLYIVIHLAVDARCYLAPKTTLSLQAKLERFHIWKIKKKGKAIVDYIIFSLPLSGHGVPWQSYVLGLGRKESFHISVLMELCHKE